jgi:hypothetical protein
MKTIKKLLSDGNSNAKTKKNSRPTKILYLHPSKIEGKDMCPFASEGCRMSCLNTAGLGGVYPSIQEARINKTRFYVLNRIDFYDQLQKEINKFALKHQSQTVAVRLNGTSDQPFVETLIVAQFRTIAPNVIFYDYTKNPKKAGIRTLPTGHKYVVTFSHSEKEDSLVNTLNVLNSGGIAAVVFNKLPDTWNGFKVVDGDASDDLMLDLPPSTVIGLKAKGKAKKDTTGFVVQI